MINPFAVTTPEKLKPIEIAELFVDMFSDFPKIKDEGHTFIHGPRGTGKSMMFRYLEPSVQKAVNSMNLVDLQFYAVHVPIKTMPSLIIKNLEEDDMLQLAILENNLIFHCVNKIIDSLKASINLFDPIISNSDIEIFARSINRIFLIAGLHIDNMSNFSVSKNTFIELLDSIKYILSLEAASIKQYVLLQNRSVEGNYIGSICTYLEFLVPFSDAVRNLSFISSGPLYLMIDDADNLPAISQKILNSWVYTRSTESICLKISTQMRYLTYKTVTNFFIESPHDFAEVDISTVYTSNKNYYYNRARDIIKKRLLRVGIDTDPEEFFETNLKQETAIEKIKDDLKTAYDIGNSKSSRRSDDATRYARIIYIKNLAGMSKNSATYSYSGFRSMVDLSSGIVRSLLEIASTMYSTQLSRLKNTSSIKSIKYQIQDDVIYSWSEDYITNEFSKILRDENTVYMEMLFNLINSLGKFFRYRIVNVDRPEKLISIMVKYNLDEDIEKVLKIGVELGYLHRSSITDKEGIGKKRIFVLNRRLAPYYKIDPSGYASHLSLTEEHLRMACNDPDRFISAKSKNESAGVRGLFDELDS